MLSMFGKASDRLLDLLVPKVTAKAAAALEVYCGCRNMRALYKTCYRNGSVITCTPCRVVAQGC